MDQNDFDQMQMRVDELIKIQKEVLNYLDLLLENRINARVSNYFNDEKEKEVYLLTDGLNTTRQIEDACGVNKNSVSSLWKKWYAQGIVCLIASNKPYKAKFSLIELALNKK